MTDVTLIIDNYDSFVYNLAQMLAELGTTTIVVRNDEISLKGISRAMPDRIIISPGPGNPERAEKIQPVIEIVRRLGGRTPILGVCLGHQIIGVAHGARIRSASRIIHGKIGRIKHRGGPLYIGVPEEFQATRYHSLVVDEATNPEELIVDAVCLDDGEIMSLRHAERPIYGVQYHPESVGTAVGQRILKNFLDLV